MRNRILKYLYLSVFFGFVYNYHFFRKLYGGEWTLITFNYDRNKYWMRRREKLGEIPLKREIYDGDMCFTIDVMFELN